MRIDFQIGIDPFIDPTPEDVDQCRRDGSHSKEEPGDSESCLTSLAAVGYARRDDLTNFTPPPTPTR
jgi:hypothetical protein